MFVLCHSVVGQYLPLAAPTCRLAECRTAVAFWLLGRIHAVVGLSRHFGHCERLRELLPYLATIQSIQFHRIFGEYDEFGRQWNRCGARRRKNRILVDFKFFGVSYFEAALAHLVPSELSHLVPSELKIPSFRESKLSLFERTTPEWNNNQNTNHHLPWSCV